MSEATVGGYPVQISFERPERYQRVHLLLRIGIWIILGWMVNTVVAILYLAGPIISAVLVAQRGGDEFHSTYGETYEKVVALLTGISAYLYLGTDQFPTWGADASVKYRYQPSGTPTVGSALLRIIMVIPHALVLWLVGIVALIAGVIAAVSVLINESVPGGLWTFLMGFVAWEARVLSYFLSMVEEYPPFSLAIDEATP